MAGVLAACERIQSTPLPFAYMLLFHRTAYLYCFLLPFGLVGSLGFATPLIGAIEINLLETLGETELPEFIQPVPFFCALFTLTFTLQFSRSDGAGHRLGVTQQYYPSPAVQQFEIQAALCSMTNGFCRYGNSCCAVHWAVGCSVTLKCTTCRRSWLSTMNTYSTRQRITGRSTTTR